MPNKQTKRKMVDGPDGKRVSQRTEMRERAITLLAQGETRAEVARQCHIHQSMLYRWLEEPKFQDVIEKRKKEIAFDVVQASANTINCAASVVNEVINGAEIDQFRAKMAFDVLKETGVLRTTGTAIGMEAKSQQGASGGITINLVSDGAGNAKIVDIEADQATD